MNAACGKALDDLNKCGGADWVKSPKLEAENISQNRVYAGEPTVEEIMKAVKDSGFYLIALSGKEGAHMIGIQTASWNPMKWNYNEFIDPNTGLMRFSRHVSVETCLTDHWNTYLQEKHGHQVVIYRCEQ